MYRTIVMVYYVSNLGHEGNLCRVLVSWFTTSLNIVTTRRCVQYWCYGLPCHLALSPLDGVNSTGVMVYYVIYICLYYTECSVLMSWSTTLLISVTTKSVVQYWCNGSLRHLSLSPLQGVYNTGVLVYLVTYICHY